jgi:hypothetical protein
MHRRKAEGDLSPIHNSACGRSGWLVPRPVLFMLGKQNLYPLHRRLGGPRRRSGWPLKISPTPEFDRRTVESVASRYIDWVISAFIVMYRNGKYECTRTKTYEGMEVKLHSSESVTIWRWVFSFTLHLLFLRRKSARNILYVRVYENVCR